MLTRLAALASAAALAAAQNGVYQQCFDEWRCIFHQNVNGQLYSWDFRPLCRRPGNEYQTQDPGGNWWAFNVCGMVSYPCIPDGWTDPFSHGIAHQYLEASPQASTTRGNPACKSTVTDPSTGAPACTSQCVMAAVMEPDYELLDNSNQNGGVEVFHAGVPPDAGAPFDCPYDPSEGCAGSRKITFLFTCDKSSKNPASLTNIFLNETSSCNYVLQGSTPAACPTKGNAFGDYRDDPNHSFGFVVLGAFLTVFLQYTYSFGDARGWWEPIKQRLPAIPGMSYLGFGGKGGIYGSGGSSKYAAVAQPIASPYGSTSM